MYLYFLSQLLTAHLTCLATFTIYIFYISKLPCHGKKSYSVLSCRFPSPFLFRLSQ